MKNPKFPVIATLTILTIAPWAARADTAVEVYGAIGIRPADVLTGTVLNAKVLQGPAKQVVAVTTYFTGSQTREDAVNVRLDVFGRAGEQLVQIYTRDFGEEAGGPVGEGELQLIDLNLDGVNEIIASYASFRDPLIAQRLAEVIVNEDGEFRSAWSGPLNYDATKAARNVPKERRDRFSREFDFANTMRTRGITLFVNKQMIAVAGERLSQPKIVQETFPLQPPTEERN